MVGRFGERIGQLYPGSYATPDGAPRAGSAADGQIVS